jgi:hypothetical protein
VPRFLLGLPVLLIAGAAMAATPGAAAATPGTAVATPPPFGLATLKPCQPDTSAPALPVHLRPGVTATPGIAGYLMPAGLTYFGIGTQVGSPYLKNNLLVGPSSFRCIADGYRSSWGLNWAELASPTDPDAQVFTYYSTSTSGNRSVEMCIALEDAGETAQLDDYRRVNPDCDGLPDRPTYQSLMPVAGTPLSVGYAVFPPGQEILTTQSPYSTEEVSIFEYTDPLTGTAPSPPVPVTYIGCALPFGRQASCLETLAEWVQTQLPAVYGTTQAQATRANAALRAQIQQDLGPAPLSAVPAEAPATGCTAPLNEGVESTLADFQPIPLQAAPRPGETGSMAAVTISAGFSPLEFHLCEQGLLGASIDPGAFEANVPTMTVRDQDQSHHTLGPFVYDAESHGWENSAQLPAGQDLDTHYDGSFRVELGPQVSATLNPAKIASGGAPDVALTLVSVTLQAKHQEVDLVRNGRELLQVVDSPQLEFSLEVSPKDVEQEVQDDEAASQEPASQVVSDAAQEIAYDDANAMVDEIEATAGVSEDFALDTLDAVEGEVTDVVRNTFTSDPALASVEAQALAEGEVVQAEQNAGVFVKAARGLEDLLDSDPEDDVKALGQDVVEAG